MQYKIANNSFNMYFFQPTVRLLVSLIKGLALWYDLSSVVCLFITDVLWLTGK